MKKNILLYGWQGFEWDPLKNELEKWFGDGFELVFATFDIYAMRKIAESTFTEKNSIRAIVFKRDAWVAEPAACKIIERFAISCLEKKVLISIAMISKEDDTNVAFNPIVGTHTAIEDNWEQVFTILITTIQV